MVKFQEDIFPLNSLAEDIEGRGSYPLVEQWVQVDPAAMVAGEIDVDVACVFGKGLGTPKFAQVMTGHIAGEVLATTVVEHASTDGQVTLTIVSSDVAGTTNFGSLWVKITGQIGV